MKLLLKIDVSRLDSESVIESLEQFIKQGRKIEGVSLSVIASTILDRNELIRTLKNQEYVEIRRFLKGVAHKDTFVFKGKEMLKDSKTNECL